MLPEHLEEDLIHQRALARTRRASDRDHLAKRDRDVHVLQVVLARAAHGQDLAVARAPLLRHGNRPRTREELAGRRRLRLEYIREGALHDNGAAMHAWSWSHLHDVIGSADGLLVMLDDDDRVADVAKTLERRDHLDVVLRMQTNARLVEHVEHAHEPGADLCGEPDAL